MEKITNILLSGVGGQGIILSANIISNMLFEAGYDVKKNEIHGMSQRGGDVTSHIRYGKEVFSPTIETETCDYLISFEMLEALRMFNYLKKGGVCIVNELAIEPAPVKVGAEKYPDLDEIKKLFSSKTDKFIVVDATSKVKELNNPRGVNIFLLGVLSNYFDLFKTEEWIDAIRRMVKPDFIEKNIKCFEAGQKI